MKIIVAGCGKTGTAVLQGLVREGHDVTALDPDREKIDNLYSTQDIMAICDSCTDPQTLTEAGVTEADLFVALTGSDELNMLSCYLAKKLGAGHTVARIRNLNYNGQSLEHLKKLLDLDVIINPERLTALSILDAIKYPDAIRCQSFTRSSFRMAQFAVHSGDPLEGCTLHDLRSASKSPFLVCGIQRGEKVLIPNGDFCLQAGDQVYVNETGEGSLFHYRRDERESKRFFRPGRERRVMIIGAGRITGYLAELLVKAAIRVKIIEKDRQQCEQAAAEYPPEVEVLCGDGTRQELLEEEQVETYDAFVSLTGNDEVNILTAFYASNCGVPKVIAKVNRSEYNGISEKIGLNCRMNPSNITTDALLRYARALDSSVGSSLETLYSLFDGGIEALEFKATAGFPACGIPLSKLPLKPNILIAGLIRGDQNIIPGGSDRILPGDHVILVTSSHRLRSLENILAE